MDVQPTEPDNLRLQDLQLLHHFTTVTAYSLSDISTIQLTWQIAVPQEALGHAFLMHALLAVAAVHLLHSSPTDPGPYERAALIHRNTALRLAVPTIYNINSTNCHALFALASFVAILALVFPQSSESQSSTVPIDEVTDFIVLVRGVTIVVHGSQEWIDRGRLRPLLRADGMKNAAEWIVNGHVEPAAPSEDRTPSIMSLPDEVSAAFDELLRWNATWTASDPASLEMYALTIRDLRRTFETIAFLSSERSLVFLWPALIKEAYLKELKIRQPMALVILAHYCVLVHSTSDKWWSTRRWEHVVEAIYKNLEPDWRPAVAWAREAVQKGIWTYWTDEGFSQDALVRRTKLAFRQRALKLQATAGLANRSRNH